MPTTADDPITQDAPVAHDAGDDVPAIDLPVNPQVKPRRVIRQVRRRVPRRTKVTSGCPSSAVVTARANRSRSTASAAPAGTRHASATRMMSEPSRRISSFKRPTALSSLSARKELLHTSSAQSPV